MQARASAATPERLRPMDQLPERFIYRAPGWKMPGHIGRQQDKICACSIACGVLTPRSILQSPKSRFHPAKRARWGSGSHYAGCEEKRDFSLRKPTRLQEQT
jgi:hypothetical protein